METGVRPPCVCGRLARCSCLVARWHGASRGIVARGLRSFGGVFLFRLFSMEKGTRKLFTLGIHCRGACGRGIPSRPVSLWLCDMLGHNVSVVGPQVDAWALAI